MNTKTCRRTYEVKEGRNWIECFSTEDPAEVYKFLAEELIAKKINACTYIRSIKRQNLYNGHQRITVTYSADCAGRAVYIIPN